jgi:NAD(P)-dependent dehydrogenase (short-subunit alcohol dehydrogenase family)
VADFLIFTEELIDPVDGRKCWRRGNMPLGRSYALALSQLGGLAALIAHFLAVTIEAFDRSYAINARATMLCYKHAARQMIEQGRGGRIIGACSISGKRGASRVFIRVRCLHFGSSTGQPICAAYSASKFAVRGLTQSAGEYGSRRGFNVCR